MTRVKWERKRWSGEVRIYLRYNDETSEWVVRAIWQRHKAEVRISSIDWVERSEAVDTNDAWHYAAVTGMGMIVSDLEHNRDIMNNCSFVDLKTVHIATMFKDAWSQFDKELASRDSK